MKQPSSVVILLCVALGLLLSACRSNRSESDSIRIRWVRDPETLDPMRLSNQATIDANNLLHVSLLHTDITKTAFVPALAEDFPAVQLVGDSLMRLTYTLRPAAAWDDGRPVTAQDVVFTLKLMRCPDLPNEVARTEFGFIRTVLPDPSNARRFVVECQGQAPEYIQASGDFFILSEQALDPRGTLRRFSLAQLRTPLPTPDTAMQAVAQRYQAVTAIGRLPGCGPYQLIKWEKDHYISFRRKAQWWADLLKPAPLVLQARPQRLTYVIIPDAATATLALQRGDLDVYPQMPAAEFTRLRASSTAREKLRFYSTRSYDVVVAGFNTKHSTLADALTRRALGQLFDAAGLLQATQLGSGQRTVGIVSPSDSTNYNNSLTPLPFSPAGGAALLRQAGWRQSAAPEAGWFRQGQNGAREQLRLTFRYRAEESLFATIALQFQSAAAKSGIPVVLRPTEAGAFTMALHDGDFDMYVRTLKGNPFIFNFTPILHSLSVGEGNTTGFSKPESDRLIEAIAAADSKGHRAQLLRQFQALMQQEMPLVPLFFLPNRIVASRRLHGVYVGSIKPGYSVMAATPLAPKALN